MVTADEIRLPWRLSLECALAEKAMHEGTDIEPDLRPERLVIGLEHDPFQAAIETLLDIECGAANRNVLVFVCELVGATQGPRTPDYRAVDGKAAQAIDANGI